MMFVKKFLLNALILSTNLYATEASIDSTVIAEEKATIQFKNSEEYVINGEINAKSGSTVIFDKPVKISTDGKFQIEGSEVAEKTMVKFNKGLTVDKGAVLTNGNNWKFDIYDTLILLQDVKFAQQGAYSGEIYLLSGDKNAIFNVTGLSTIENPGNPDYQLTVVGDGATQFQYMTDDEISGGKAWKDKGTATIRDRLNNILKQPIRMGKMIIKNYEVSAVSKDDVVVNTDGDGNISTKLNGFETLINDDIKPQCIAKGLIVSDVELGDDVKNALKEKTANAIKDAMEGGKKVTIKEWEATPISFAPPSTGTPEEQKTINLNFNIGDIDNATETDETKTFSVNTEFPNDSEENKVALTGKIAKNVIVKLSGNVNVTEIAPGAMPRLDFSELKGQQIKFILCSTTQTPNNEGGYKYKLKDDNDTSSNATTINEETFILGSKNLHFETGENNTINFDRKDKSNSFEFKISKYVGGANSTTNIKTGVTLSL